MVGGDVVVHEQLDAGGREVRDPVQVLDCLVAVAARKSWASTTCTGSARCSRCEVGEGQARVALLEGEAGVDDSLQVAGHVIGAGGVLGQDAALGEPEPLLVRVDEVQHHAVAQRGCGAQGE